MEKKSDYLTRNMLLIFHVYLAIFAITVTTLLVFKFYTYQVSATPEVRPYVLESIKDNALTSSVARGNVAIAMKTAQPNLPSGILINQ